MSITEKQKTALSNLAATGTGFVPVIHAGALLRAGLIADATRPSEIGHKGGFKYAALTEAGRAAL